MKVLLTGAAGFIGMHSAQRLLADGHQVHGVDSENDYYDPGLKTARLAELDQPGFTYTKGDIAEPGLIAGLFAAHGPFDRVIHLAAQAGVRFSLSHPQAYVRANLEGFLAVLEGCRQYGTGHLVYASSSSVYGMNRTMPFATADRVDHPVSLYAASKKANELMAHSYSHLYDLPTTGLRFFTVYGPWGRPDMAYFLFAEAMRAGRPIQLFNHGKMRRDFTYIDDIVEGVVRVMEHIPRPDASWTVAAGHPAESSAPYRVFNIGHNQPEALEHLVACLEDSLGWRAEREWQPMQPGDVLETCADIEDLERAVGYRPTTSLATGISRFAQWYRAWAGV